MICLLAIQPLMARMVMSSVSTTSSLTQSRASKSRATLLLPMSPALPQTKELKNAEARIAQRLAALAHSPSLPDLSTGSPSPTLTTVQQRKADKYRLLLKMVLSQAQNKERGAVNFVAFAFSTSGELCPAAEALVERIVQTYRRKLKAEGPRDDGLSTAHLTHLFRFEFLVAIQVAIARGVSKVLTFAGLPLPLSW